MEEKKLHTGDTESLDGCGWVKGEEKKPNRKIKKEMLL